MISISPPPEDPRLAESTRLMHIAKNAATLVGAPLRAAFRSAMTVDYKVDLHRHGA